MLVYDQLKTLDNADGTWTLTEDFTVSINRFGSAKVIVHVPAGYTTDYASVPWFLRWLMSKAGRHGYAAVVHDYCYSQVARDPQKFDRAISDVVFLFVMKRMGVPWWRRWGAYLAVRLFGGIHLKRTSKINKQES